MKVFISVAAPDRPHAEEVDLALRGAGHQVFLDQQSLSPGGEFYRTIREAIRQADLVIFFISKFSIENDRYTLAELEIIKDRFRHPAGRVLPVILDPTVKFDRIPPYLRAVTFCQPQGNLAAAVEFEVSRMADAIARDGQYEHRSSVFAVASGAEGSPFARTLEAVAAGVGFGAVAVVLSLLSHEVFAELKRMADGPVEGTVYLILGKLVALALPIWLAALFFNVKSPVAYVALGVGCAAAAIFELQLRNSMEDYLVALYIGKSFVLAACAGVVLRNFRTLQALAIMMAFGALSGLLIDMYGKGMSGFVWEGLAIGAGTFVLAWNGFVQPRANEVRPV